MWCNDKYRYRCYDEWYNSGYLFSWDNIQGNDNVRLINFIDQNFSINRANVNIEKIDGETIKISSENNTLFLKLNNEKTKATLTINKSGIASQPVVSNSLLIRIIEFIHTRFSGKIALTDNRTYEFTARKKNGKLNVYNSSDKDDQVHNFYRFTNCIAEMMRIHYPEKFELHSHEVGAHIFFRNLAFISLSILII
jgi:hypothetical protein